MYLNTLVVDESPPMHLHICTTTFLSKLYIFCNTTALNFLLESNAIPRKNNSLDAKLVMPNLVLLKMSEIYIYIVSLIFHFRIPSLKFLLLSKEFVESHQRINDKVEAKYFCLAVIVR